ncbi:RNA recognition family protein, partial [Cryptosporidium andersoni]
MDKLRDNDTIDDDEWYAGLGVVPISTDKTGSEDRGQKETIGEEKPAQTFDNIAIEEENQRVQDSTMHVDGDELDDAGGLILADEVNSRSYHSLPYVKATVNSGVQSKCQKSLMMSRKDRVIFLGPPPELSERAPVDISSGGVVTRVGSIIVISNLMWWINDIQIRELAMEFGTLRAIRIIERPKDGRSLGICLIEYVNPESSPKALQGISASFAKKYDGRPLYVVPLPLHGELHVALDHIVPHWSRGGIINEDILAMICQLVGVDIQTAGLEIQPETGTIVGFVQPRFADYASYYFPDGTPSWFPPLYVEALRHIKDMIPPAKLANRLHTNKSNSGRNGRNNNAISTNNAESEIEDREDSVSNEGSNPKRASPNYISRSARANRAGAVYDEEDRDRGFRNRRDYR